VVSIPGRSDEDVSTGAFFEEEEVIQRMVIYRDSSPIAKAISNSPPLQNLVFNTPIRGVTYDDSNLRDKVALDFINCIIDGVSSRDRTGEDVSPRNTLHILIDPSPDDFIDEMEHCLVLNTTSRRQNCGAPAFRALFGVCVDV